MFVDALVNGFRPLNFEFVFGMNGVRAFGGVHIGAEGCVTLGARRSIDHDVDVSATAGDDKGQTEGSFRGMTAGGAAALECDGPVPAVACKDLVVDEADFIAKFDASKRQWTVSWKWSGDEKPSGLKNSIGEYRIKPEARAE